jgi:hypothetical protein
VGNKKVGTSIYLLFFELGSTDDREKNKTLKLISRGAIKFSAENTNECIN